MQLNPTNIEKHLHKLGKLEAIDLLKEWIYNSNDKKLRQEALEVLGRLDDGKNFSFFEQLFLSDANLTISLISGKILCQKYSNHKKTIPLLKYILENVRLIDKKFLALEILKRINNKDSLKVLRDYLRKMLKSTQIKELNRPPEKIIPDSNYTINEKLINYCFNLILYDYYINRCGFNVTLRKGKIILLNCEGSGFRSISEIPAINRLVDLEHLILKRNKISNICDIEHLNNLQILDLSENQISKINSLGNLLKLKDLILTSNKITKIENVNNLPKLEKLAINHNELTEIQQLNGLKNLEDLNLNNNKISSISGLRDLPNLEKLNLSFNHITKISGLNELKNLHWLHLNNNEIEKIQGLDNLIELKGLYLSNNKIEKIENLDNLKELRKIELSNNNIHKIEGLNSLHKLQELFLDKNKICKIKGIDSLGQLIILFIKSNKITHFSNEKIENLHNLNFIFLNDNPLTPESKICYNRRSRYP